MFKKLERRVNFKSVLLVTVLCVSLVGLLGLTGCGVGATLGSLNSMMNQVNALASQANQVANTTRGGGGGGTTTTGSFAVQDLAGTWSGPVTVQNLGSGTLQFQIDGSGNTTVSIGGASASGTATISASGAVSVRLVLQAETDDYQGQMSADKTQIAMSQIVATSLTVGSQTVGCTGTLTKAGTGGTGGTGGTQDNNTVACKLP